MRGITTVVFDVDGTLTTGDVGLTVSNGVVDESKSFSIKDGLVLKIMPVLGVDVVFLTGRRSMVTEHRARELDVADVIQGVSDKRAELARFVDERGISWANVAYVGDDLNDYDAMRSCGYRACPADAATEIRELADYVSPYSGGRGAGRDVCERILQENGTHTKFLELFKVSQP